MGLSSRALGFCLLVLTTGVAVADVIHSLPGLKNAPSFRMYSGYITVNQSHGRELFYMFFESQNSPANDPLVMWLNGGPGCSSLEGAFGENGPFYPTQDGSLEANPNAWNKVANMLYVESPAGVGFSRSNVTSDYTVGDARTAADLVELVRNFQHEFPAFARNDFWVTGESYGGHYVPKTVEAIVAANKAGTANINIKGYMVGNAWTDATLDNKGAAFMWWSHAFNSEATYQAIMSNCDFAHIGPLEAVDPVKCERALSASTAEMGNVNIYDLYADVCLSGASSNGRELMRRLADAGNVVGSAVHKQGEGQLDPCIDDHLVTYLNRADVQRSIHAPARQWTTCSTVLDYSRADLLTSMLPVYQRLMQEDLRILVYSGDVDGIVPVTGTRSWIAALNMDVEEPWRPWTASDKQVGGYVVRYSGLTFATVREAGHMVPWTQGLRALDMFSRMLLGRL